MAKWSNLELDILINNYPKYGVDYCCELLDRSKYSILSKASELKLKKNNLLVNNINDVNFIKQHYFKYGGNYCAEKLNKSLKYINRLAYRLGLNVDTHVKIENSIEKKRINNFGRYDVDNFININSKEISYFLGYFWADGHIGKYTSTVSSISLVNDDAEFLYSIISRVSNCWKLSNSIKKYWTDEQNNKIYVKNQKKIHTFSKKIYEFLYENDFSKKSNNNFNKIWLLIPDELKHYFILGFFDGDGCFINHSTDFYRYGRVVFTGSYDSDWLTLENFLIKNGVEYKIYRTKVLNGGSSRLDILKQDSVYKLYMLLYQDVLFHGLNRKYEKFINFYK